MVEREGVDLRLHSVIYDVTDELKKALAGMLEPQTKETQLGAAEVRQTFKVPKFGTAAGSLVTDGVITRSGDAQARLVRDGVVVHQGGSDPCGASRMTSARSRTASSAGFRSRSSLT